MGNCKDDGGRWKSTAHNCNNDSTFDGLGHGLNQIRLASSLDRIAIHPAHLETQMVEAGQPLHIFEGSNQEQRIAPRDLALGIFQNLRWLGIKKWMAQILYNPKCFQIYLKFKTIVGHVQDFGHQQTPELVWKIFPHQPMIQYQKWAKGLKQLMLQVKVSRHFFRASVFE